MQKIEKKKHFSRLVCGFRPITHERLGVYYLLSSAETLLVRLHKDIQPLIDHILDSDGSRY